jgi:hypothetical protein
MLLTLALRMRRQRMTLPQSLPGEAFMQKLFLGQNVRGRVAGSLPDVRSGYNPRR